MSAFEMVHQDRVAGKLVCFDRVIFKGHLSRFFPAGGFKAFLDAEGVLLKDYGRYVAARTAELKAHAKTVAESAGRPYIYLSGAHTKAGGNSKEDLARQIAERDGISAGLICVLAAVENCTSFDINNNRDSHRLEVVRRRRKCLFIYFYRIDAELGFCHVRVQSWFPFEIQIWCNGREMLSRALEREGIGHVRYLNSIVACDDWEAAQALADRLAKRRWVGVLNALAREHNPVLARIGRAGFGGYWWVSDQAEVATDVAFADREHLEEVLPGLFAHATATFSATDVLRFLGRKLHPTLTKEVTTSTRRRPEGWRVRHTMGRNSIKVYDKANVLRVETTINDPSQFRTLRMVEGNDGRRHPAWRPMRKGVANLGRYHQVGRAANERYLEALSTASDHSEAVAALDDLCRPAVRQGRRTASFNPVTRPDLALFKAALAGGHTILGFRNNDLNERLHLRPPRDDQEARRRSARTSRQIAKLRGHGLISKVKDQRLYRVTPHGQRIMAAALAVHDRDFPAAYNQPA
jgi:hypothetical protein